MARLLLRNSDGRGGAGDASDGDHNGLRSERCVCRDAQVDLSHADKGGDSGKRYGCSDSADGRGEALEPNGGAAPSLTVHTEVAFVTCTPARADCKSTEDQRKGPGAFKATRSLHSGVPHFEFPTTSALARTR